MRIKILDKEKVYDVKLSGWQIEVINQALLSAELNNAFNEKGFEIAMVLKKTLEDLE